MTQMEEYRQAEAVLRDALRACPEEDLLTEGELRKQGIEPHRFSPEFEKKMKALIRQQRRKEWLKKHGVKSGGLIAALVSLVFGDLPDPDDLK